MSQELLDINSTFGSCFQYDDYDFEALLGPREIRKMTIINWDNKGYTLYEGEWLRDTNIPHGRCVALFIDPTGNALYL